MDWLSSSFFSQIFNLLVGLGAIIFALAYAWERYRKGGQQADQDTITSLTEALKAQKEINDTMSSQMEALRTQIADLKQEIGKLQGINEANDKKIQEYLQIIANRNPELEQTLESLEVLIRQVMPFMADVRKWHTDLRKQLKMRPIKEAAA